MQVTQAPYLVLHLASQGVFPSAGYDALFICWGIETNADNTI